MAVESYKVRWTEYHEVVVKAKSKEEAKEKALDGMTLNHDIDLNSKSVKISKVKK